MRVSEFAPLLLLLACACGEAPLAPQPRAPAPPPTDAELAATAATEDARLVIESLGAPRRVAVWRAGLRLPPGPAAAACARALDWKHLDADEQGLATRHLVDGILGQGSEPEEGEFWHVLEYVSSADLDGILDRLPPPDAAVLDHAKVGLMHKVSRPRHLPRLAELSAVVEASEFHELLSLAIQCTDQHRDAVARWFLGDKAPRAPPAPPSSESGVPPLLRACLDWMFLRADADGGGRFGHWAGRWLRDVVATEADADLLVRLDDAGWHDALALWQMRHLRDDLTGARLLELADFGDPDPAEFQMLAWGALAVRGDARALVSLRPVAAREGIALALLLRFEPRRALDALAGVLLDPEASDQWRGEVAVCFAAVEEARWEVRDHFGIEWEENAFDGFEERALASNVDGLRLARIGHAVPGCGTSRLAAEAARRLRHYPPDGWFATRVPAEALGFVELGAPDELRATLRAWAADEDRQARRAALETLLLLGDPGAGPGLVTALRAGLIDPNVGDSGLEVLARSPCPEVVEFLRGVARGDEPPPRRAARWQAVWALAILGGLPENVEFRIPDAAETTLEAEVTSLVLADRAIDAYAALLAAAPDRKWSGAGDVRDPRVTDYLERLRRERHLAQYAFATAELAIQGDLAARKEQLRVLRAGHYRWAEDLDARQATFGFDLDMVPAWIDAVESNDCQASTARSTLSRTIGVSVHRSSGYGFTEADGFRRWWSEHEGPLSWSRLAESFRPVPR